MKLLLATLLACTVIVGQSRQELVSKYGEPISETFLVRPGISVTVIYAPNRSIAELMISPRTTAFIKSRGTTLSKASVNAIIDELVPVSERGKYIVGEFTNSDCLPENDCAGASESYQNVTIYYNAGPKGRVTYAIVQWKR
jgi:hypothetical protein